MDEELKHAIEFVLDNARSFEDCGPCREGWRSDSMLASIKVLQRTVGREPTGY